MDSTVTVWTKVLILKLSNENYRTMVVTLNMSRDVTHTIGWCHLKSDEVGDRICTVGDMWEVNCVEQDEIFH